MRRQNSARIASCRHRIKCITFDLDDTLWECKPVIHRAEAKFYEWLGHHHPKVTRRYSYEALIQSRIAYMQANQHQAFDLTRLRKNWLAQIVAETGASSEVVEAGFQVFWKARNQVDLFEGVRDTLQQLGSHFILGSITNGNADIHQVGLGDIFDFSVTAAEAGVAKPEKAIFQRAADKADVALNKVLHVGDDSDRDVIGALHSGAMAAWVTPEEQPQWPHKDYPQLV
ncbi:MAG TPA: HAD family hydrolase, partial [Gammaproteobacteria bacterium]|nr:HAD family hydrolase [Gammaproteobacteria bacterium]